MHQPCLDIAAAEIAKAVYHFHAGYEHHDDADNDLIRIRTKTRQHEQPGEQRSIGRAKQRNQNTVAAVVDNRLSYPVQTSGYECAHQRIESAASKEKCKPCARQNITQRALCIGVAFLVSGFLEQR